jgi:hypothetical protein
VEPPPGHLRDQQRHPRPARLIEAADWYLAAPGLLQQVGRGDLSLEDLQAVQSELAEKYKTAGFVAVGRRREIEQVLSSTWGTKRITWSERLGRPIAPRLSAIARGARLACVPQGIFFVDEEGFFTAGEQARFPWTEPEISLPVIRARELRRVLVGLVGKSGPRRAELG